MNCIREGMSKVKIGEKEYLEIHIMDANGGLIASITDEDIIEEKNCKVVCVPVVDTVGGVK